MKNKSA